MSYGTIKVDTITFTDNSVDKSVSLSGLIQNPTFTGNITVTGTISGDVIRGGTTVSGATVTGTTANFVSGVFTTQISGATVTGTTASFTSGVFTNISGTTAIITSGIIASGTAAAPSLAILADLDTGLFSPGADQVAVATNGVGRLFVDASGNIKITTYQYQALSHKNFGYSGSYGALVVGAGGNNYGNISLGVDVSSISGGAFNGQNQVIFPATGGIIPNNAGTDYVGFYNRNSSDSLVLGPAVVGGITSGPLTLTSTSVGIGTSSPGQLLDVAGVARFGVNATKLTTYSDSTYAGFFNGSSLASNESIYMGAGGTFFYNNGSPSVTIDSTGRVGIGTSSPQKTFHVLNPGSTYQADLRLGGTSTYYFDLSHDPTTTGKTIYNAYALSGTSHGHQFQVAGTNALLIDSSGRVGIGTTSPGYKLDVQDAIHIRVDGSSLANLYFSGTGTRIRYNDGTGNLSFFTNSAERAYVGYGGGFVILNALSVGGDVTLSGGDRSIINNDNNALAFGTNATERARIDSSGRLLVGTSTSRDDGVSFQLEGVGYLPATLQITRNSNNADGGGIYIQKTRGTAVGGTTIVQSGDELGYIKFRGADGTDAQSIGAQISAAVDGTPGANDMPGRLVFSTTADGAASPTERMRITNLGVLKQSTTGTYLSTTARYNEFSNLNATSGDINTYFTLGAGTSDTSSVFIYCFQSGVGGKMVVYGNGNIQNTNNSYGALSDIKLKENIVDANSQWDDIKALQVRNYNLKEGQTHTQIGLVAQEVEPVSPGLVYESPDRDAEGNDLGTVTKSVNYSVLYMKAVKALQEAMERIEQLEANNADLLARVSALESA
jgi:hypothetical protein